MQTVLRRMVPSLTFADLFVGTPRDPPVMARLVLGGNRNIDRSVLIDHGKGPAPDWPELMVVEHRGLERRDARRLCAGQPWFALGMVDACVYWRFDLKECHIWLSAELPPPTYVVEHERMHRVIRAGSSSRSAAARSGAAT